MGCRGPEDWESRDWGCGSRAGGLEVRGVRAQGPRELGVLGQRTGDPEIGGVGPGQEYWGSGDRGCGVWGLGVWNPGPGDWGSGYRGCGIWGLGVRSPRGREPRSFSPLLTLLRPVAGL